MMMMTTMMMMSSLSEASGKQQESATSSAIQHSRVTSATDINVFSVILLVFRLISQKVNFSEYFFRKSRACTLKIDWILG